MRLFDFMKTISMVQSKYVLQLISDSVNSRILPNTQNHTVFIASNTMSLHQNESGRSGQSHRRAAQWVETIWKWRIPVKGSDIFQMAWAQERVRERASIWPQQGARAAERIKQCSGVQISDRAVDRMAHYSSHRIHSIRIQRHSWSYARDCTRLCSVWCWTSMTSSEAAVHSHGNWG